MPAQTVLHQVDYSSSSSQVDNQTIALMKGSHLKHQLSKSFMVAVQPLSTRLIKPSFCDNQTRFDATQA